MKKLLLLSLVILNISCVYRPNLQQGNLLNLENLDRIEIGMTKSQIRYLLGGPVIGTPYESERWDYIYLFQPRMNTDNNESQRYWLIVNFTNGLVSSIEKDVATEDS
jgi:outer membrane protein assembly factor BamE